MNKKILHVVCGPSNMGSLRMALKRLNIDDDVIYNPLGLADHYLPKDFSDRELCFALASCDQIELFDEVKKFIYTDFSNYAKIVVWHGWSSDELLFLYLMSVLVDENLYRVDIRDCSSFMAKKPKTPFPYMGYVSPFDIYSNNMVSLAKPISDTDKQYYKEQWYHWVNSPFRYRFSDINTGVIQGYPDDFMDSCIIESAKKDPRISHIVGNVMTQFNTLSLWDSVIERRIKKLWENGFLDLKVFVSEK